MHNQYLASKKYANLFQQTQTAVIVSRYPTNSLLLGFPALIIISQSNWYQRRAYTEFINYINSVYKHIIAKSPHPPIPPKDLDSFQESIFADQHNVK